MTEAAKLYRRQLRNLRKSRDAAMASARFVRDHGYDAPLVYVQKARLDHAAIMQMLKFAP